MLLHVGVGVLQVDVLVVGGDAISDLALGCPAGVVQRVLTLEEALHEVLQSVQLTLGIKDRLNKVWRGRLQPLLQPLVIVLEMSEDAGHLISPLDSPLRVVLVASHLPRLEILPEDAVLEVVDLLQYFEVGVVGAVNSSMTQLDAIVVPLQTRRLQLQRLLL